MLQKTHHLLGGENSLDMFASDLVLFVRWQMTHSTRKKLLYDKKKFVTYYLWDDGYIKSWFAEQGLVLHTPQFLTESGDCVGVKLSVGRMVKGRRHQRDCTRLVNMFGNENASHTVIRKDGKNTHTIYVNAAVLSRKVGMGLYDYIRSDRFVEVFKGSACHELMHVFDKIRMPKKKRKFINEMKKTYKGYRSDFGIGKEFVTFEKYGDWNCGKFKVDVDVVRNPDHLRTFFYMLLYYLTDTEMNAYLQTFANQLNVCVWNSGTYRRYYVIREMLKMDFGGIIDEVIDDRFVSDFTHLYPKLKNKDTSLIYHRLRKMFLKKVEHQLYRMNRIGCDVCINTQ